MPGPSPLAGPPQPLLQASLLKVSRFRVHSRACCYRGYALTWDVWIEVFTKCGMVLGWEEKVGLQTPLVPEQNSKDSENSKLGPAFQIILKINETR